MSMEKSPSQPGWTGEGSINLWDVWEPCARWLPDNPGQESIAMAAIYPEDIIPAQVEFYPGIDGGGKKIKVSAGMTSGLY